MSTNGKVNNNVGGEMNFGKNAQASDVIDLKELFLYLMGDFLIIFFSTLIGGLIMLFMSKCVFQEKFQSTTAIYVLNRQDNQSVTYSDLQTGTQLTKDYAQLVKSRTVTSKVISELDLQNRYEDMKDITPDELAGMISVSTPQDTRIIRISITDTDPTRAQDIANAVRSTSARHIYEVMDTEAVNVVDEANLPEHPVRPNTPKNIIIGLLLGFVLSVGVLTVIFVADDTIKTPDEVEKYLGLSVLASIPYNPAASISSSSKKTKRKRKQAKPVSKIPESSRPLQTIKLSGESGKGEA